MFILYFRKKSEESGRDVYVKCIGFGHGHAWKHFPKRESNQSTKAFCFFTVCYSLLYHSPRIMVGDLIVFKFVFFFFLSQYSLSFSLPSLERRGKRKWQRKSHSSSEEEKEKEKEKMVKIWTSKTSLPSWSTPTIFIEILYHFPVFDFEPPRSSLNYP